MKIISIIAASTMLATPVLAQDIETEKTVEEVFALNAGQEADPLAPVKETEDHVIIKKKVMKDSDEGEEGDVVEKEVEKRVVVKKIDQDGNETEEEIDTAQIERMKSDCPGRVFKTSVESVGEDGEKSKQAVTLCSDSATDDAWIEFLNNAKRQIALNDNIPVDARDQLLADLDAEIKRTISGTDG